MSRTGREGIGLWLPISIAVILAAAGVRYASSTEWWSNFFNRERQALRTVNTGVSVQVADSTTSVPAAVASPRPLPDTTQPPVEGEPARRRMW